MLPWKSCVTAASATLGPIIPPSLPFVIYGMMANVSIGALFLAVGGVLISGCMTLLALAGLAWRMIPLVAGWPETVCGTTVDRQCGSSQKT